MKKSITYDEYLQAKGLFSLAQEHSRKSFEYTKGLENLLDMTDDISAHTPDMIFDDTLEEGLRRDGIAVELETSPKSEES